MNKQKYIYCSLMIICFSLCIFAGLFVASGVAFANDETTETSEITEYNILYLDSDKSHTPLETTNPAKVSVSDLPITIYAPATTKTGYNFAYWGAGKLAPLDDKPDGNFQLTREFVQDYAKGDTLTLYAYWELIEYKISFAYSGYEYGVPSDPDGFTSLGYIVTAETDIDLTKTEYMPKCMGHKFEGWFSDSAYTTAITQLKNVTSDVTLYGKFTRLDYRITFADKTLGFDDIPFKSGIDYAYDYNGHQGLLTNLKPTKDGYIFAGWYSTENCEEGTQVGKFYIFQTPITLYAKWTKAPSPIWLYAICGACVLIVGGFVWWYFANKRKLWS